MYLIDSDVLIDAKNFHYGFDLVPGFWTWIEKAHLAGKVFVVQKIADEVYGQSDELAAWMKAQPDSFRLAPQEEDVPCMQAVAEWAQNCERLRQSAIATFLNCGDFYIISQALRHGYTVVTQELPAPESKTSVKIPDACMAVGVDWVSPFEMLRRENAQL